jgi:hypothetical protein
MSVGRGDINAICLSRIDDKRLIGTNDSESYKNIGLKMDSKIAELFKDHSDHFIEMALSWDRREPLDDPDAYGRRTGECGDTVEFFLRIKDNRIFRICFKKFVKYLFNKYSNSRTERQKVYLQFRTQISTNRTV